MRRLLAVFAVAALALVGVAGPAPAAKPIPVTAHITYVVGQWTTQEHTTFALTARAVGVTSTYGVTFEFVAHGADGRVVTEGGGNVPMRSGAGTSEWSSAPFTVTMPSAYQVAVTASLYKQKGRAATTVDTVSGTGVVANLKTWDAWVTFYPWPSVSAPRRP